MKIYSSFVQPTKAFRPIHSTFNGIQTNDKLMHERNVLLAISFKYTGKVIEVNDEQYSNAEQPIDCTLSGMYIEDSL